MNVSLVEQFATFYGIETEFTDLAGNNIRLPQDKIQNLLNMLGVNTDDDVIAEQQLTDLKDVFWENHLFPVSVQQAADTFIITLQVTISQANEPVILELETEQHEKIRFELIPVEGELTDASQLKDTEYHQYRHIMPHALPEGYHKLTIVDAKDDKPASQHLVITPDRCYQPAEFTTKRQWGVAIQLYALRSARNWGIGDFTDLANLNRYLARYGADFVGLNPVHALYPAVPENASPYSPSSRRWLNIVYIDVTAMPGYPASSAAAMLINSASFQQQLAELRQDDWVNYTGVMQLKLPLMRILYQWFSEQITELAELHRAFRDFKNTAGESLQQLALYDALHAFLLQQNNDNWGWPVWPEEYQAPDSEQVKQFAAEHDTELDFYCYLQFIAQRQLQAAQQIAKESGMLLGLYRDLAVGVSTASTEIWSNPDLYCRRASIGAPPDAMGPAGQNWGLPPMYAHKLYQQAYQPTVELFRANMQDSGALRIDHVMGLLRLWWVPEGAKTADEGAYLYYPVEDVLNILALESQRQKTVIVGEDLGTVPAGIRELLAKYGIYSYKVFLFEQAADGGFISPAHYQEQALATITTHDLPTLTGFWHCDDLRLGKEVGIYQDDVQLQQLYQQRHINKQRILDTLHGHKMLPEDFPRSAENLQMTRELNYAIQRHMAAGASQLLCLQLEDWLEMDKPVNIPGTSNEYPNWRRKLSNELEQWAEDEHIDNLLRQITILRAVKP